MVHTANIVPFLNQLHYTLPSKTHFNAVLPSVFWYPTSTLSTTASHHSSEYCVHIKPISCIYWNIRWPPSTFAIFNIQEDTYSEIVQLCANPLPPPPNWWIWLLSTVWRSQYQPLRSISSACLRSTLWYHGCCEILRDSTAATWQQQWDSYGCTIITFMQDLRFSQQSWRGFTSSGMWLYPRLLMLDNEGAMFLQNISNLSRNNTLPHPRGQNLQLTFADMFMQIQQL